MMGALPRIKDHKVSTAATAQMRRSITWQTEAAIAELKKQLGGQA